MLQKEDFKKESALAIQWVEDYLNNLHSYPVKSQVAPGHIYNQLPGAIPQNGTDLADIIKDTTDIILPGITHWQHPNFHAYFPANSSVESILAELITAAIGAQCMIWDTSPAAAELEERVLQWLRDAMGLPRDWEGVIQDTASTATLVAIICAREKTTAFRSNEEGVPPNLRIYCSNQTHSSIEKAVVIAGIGRKNVVKIETDEKQRLDPILLERQIQSDLAHDLKPCCIVAAIGTTGTVAIDDIAALAAVAHKYNIWLHVDAAYAGTALLLPEYQWMIKDIESANSFVFNPHKWLFTNFDCTAYYVKDADHLIKTFEILPEYLKTKTRGQVNDYRDWGIPLGRRFRALKLWFVLRSYGLNGIQKKLRKHIALNTYFAEEIKKSTSLELVQDPILNFTCFRYVPVEESHSLESQNNANQRFVELINHSGKAFLSHTMIDGQYVIRVVIGQTYVEREDIDRLLTIIIESVAALN